MDDATATISAPTSGGDGGGSSAPSSAPSPAPATAPSTPATPAPSSTPAPTEQKDISGIISDAVAKSYGEAEKTLGKPAEPAPPEVPARATETPAPPAEEAKPAAEAAPPVAEPNPLDKLGPLPAEKIAAAFKDLTPEVTALLKEKGLDVDVLTETARSAALTSQYQERFPDMESADTALKGAQDFWKLERGMTGMKTVDDYNNFMTQLAEMTYIRDEDGNPIPDPNMPGSFKNDGSLQHVMAQHLTDHYDKMASLGALMIKGAKSEDEKNYADDIVTATKFLDDFIKAGYRAPGTQTDIKTLPADVQSRLAEAERIKTEAQTSQTQQQQTQLQMREDKILDATYDAIKPVFKVLEDSALPESVKTMVADKVFDEVTAAMESNDLFKQQRDSLSPRAKDYEARRVAINKQYMTTLIAKSLAKIIPQVGGPIVESNKQRQDKIAAQQQAGRMEPRSGSTTPQSHPGPLTSPDDIEKKALEMARAENPNAGLGSREFYQAIFKLKSMPISA